MISPWQRLQEAFVEDHRSMIRAYKDLIQRLTERDFVAATHSASRLDTIAGPHIEFEEKCLYPQIAQTRGDAYTSRLYNEHDEVLAVLEKVLQLGAKGTPNDQELGTWIDALRLGIEHASACGSMLGDLRSLSETEQLQLLDGLTRLREQGSRWSELQSPPTPADRTGPCENGSNVR